MVSSRRPHARKRRGHGTQPKPGLLADVVPLPQGAASCVPRASQLHALLLGLLMQQPMGGGWEIAVGADGQQPLAGALAQHGLLVLGLTREVIQDVVKCAEVRALLLLADGQGPAQFQRPLIAVLKDEDKLVRRNAAGALGELGDARAVKPLEGLLGDENENVRAAARGALATLRRPSEGKPFDGAQDKPLGKAQDKSFGAAQDKSFGAAQDKP